jgi:hypothetical protein
MELPMPGRPNLRLLALVLFVWLAAEPGAAAPWRRSPAASRAAARPRLPEPLPKLDPYDIPAFLRRLERSRAPGARLLRRQIANGPRDLARQRAAARREGIPLSPRDLRQSTLPADQNAALIYRRLARLLKDKPLDPQAWDIARDLGVQKAHTAAEIDRVRKLLVERRDVMALIEAATDRPRCDFYWYWAQAPDVVWVDDMPAMRRPLILLSAQSYLLARDGRYPEAVRTQARCFRIAEHAASHQVVVTYLIGTAYARMAFSGMENILHLAGANARVASAVSEAIAAHRPKISLGDALRREAIFNTISTKRLREVGPPMLVKWTTWPEFDAEGREVSPNRPVRALSTRDRRTWRRMLTAAEAAYLQQTRQAIAGLEKPYPTRRAFYNQLDYLSARPSIAERLFGGMTSLSYVRLDARWLQSEARGAVLTAGAALLAHKARHGAFPERLEQALLRPPRDPFGGQALRYRREDEGFVVYSVGHRGSYDGRGERESGGEESVRFRYPAPPPRPPPGMDAPAPDPPAALPARAPARAPTRSFRARAGARAGC